MSTLKTDAIISATSGADLSLSGDAGGVVDIEAGFKVGGSVGVPTASIQDDAVTLAKMAAGTDGNLISFDASGNPVAVATGNDGQVLTSTGAGSPPAFETPAGGGAWEILSTAEVTGTTSSVEFTNLDTTHGQIAVMLSGVRASSNANVPLMTVGTSSGYIASNKYNFHVRSYGPASDTEDVERSTSNNYIYLSANSEMSSEGAYNCLIYINDDSSHTSSTRYRPNITGMFWMNHHTFNTGAGGIITGTVRDISASLDRIKFICGNNNFVLGRFTVYGIKHA